MLYQICHGAVSFADEEILHDINCEIRNTEKIAVVGRNGCGKTTLLKQLMSEGGGVRFGASVTVSYFDQTQSDLNDKNTALGEIQNRFPDKTESELRGALAAFLFKGDDVFKKVGSLSGGERARLAILKIMLAGSNFLLLDEPTNHLDVYSRQALENALAEYGGTMLIVSHDRRFIDRLADRIFVMENGGITQYEGNYTYYVEKRGNAPADTVKITKTAGAGGQEYKKRKQLASDIRRLKSAVSAEEQRTSALEKELGDIDAMLCSEETAADYVRVAELTERAAQINRELEEVLDRWTELSVQLEQLENEQKRGE